MIHYIKRVFSGKFKLFYLTILVALPLSLDGIGGPYFLGRFTDELTAKSFDKAQYVVAWWLLFLICMALSKSLYTYLIHKMRMQLNLELKRREVSRSITKKGRKTTSEHVSVISSEIKQIDEKFVLNTFTFVYCILQGILTFSFLMTINIPVGLVFVGLGIIPVVIPKLTANWIRKMTMKWQEENHRYIKYLEDFLRSRQLILRYSVTTLVAKLLSRKLEKQEKAYNKMENAQVLSNMLVSILYVVTLLLGLFLGISSVKEGKLTVGELLTIYSAADRVISPFVTCVNLYGIMNSVTPILDNVLAMPIKDNRTVQYRSTMTHIMEIHQGTIGFPDKVLMADVDFYLSKGERILIQAPSGTGKSTFLKNLLGENSLLTGELIFHQTLKMYDDDIFAFVEQHPFLFDESLRFNVTLGRDIEDTRLIAVLHQVGLIKYANTQGLDTFLDKEGQQLSGGELKRLELARALLSERPLLIVDEGLSGLDDESATVFHQLLMDYPGTVIDIEHHITPELIAKYNRTFIIQHKKLIQIPLQS